MKLVRLAVFAAFVLVLAASGSNGATVTPIEPLPSTAFHPVVLPEAQMSSAPTAFPTPTPTPRPSPAPRQTVTPARTTPPVLTPHRSSSAGMATWFCNATHAAPMSRCYHGKPDVAGDQLFAAIRGSRTGPLAHRGDDALVCRADDHSVCVQVHVIDCLCAGSANLIDLYSDAFLKLAPLGRGHVHIVLRWLS